MSQVCVVTIITSFEKEHRLCNYVKTFKKLDSALKYTINSIYEIHKKFVDSGHTSKLMSYRDAFKDYGQDTKLIFSCRDDELFKGLLMFGESFDIKYIDSHKYSYKYVYRIDVQDVK